MGCCGGWSNGWNPLAAGWSAAAGCVPGAVRWGWAGDGKNCVHAGLVSRHPWRSTPPPSPTARRPDRFRGPPAAGKRKRKSGSADPWSASAAGRWREHSADHGSALPGPHVAWPPWPRHHAALQLWTLTLTLTLTLLQKRAAGPQARQPHPITSCRHPARDGPPHGAASAGSTIPPAPRTPSPRRCTAWARARPGHPGSAPRRSAG